MSVCDGCGQDDIFGSRKERRNRQTIGWLCDPCRERLRGLVPRDPPDNAWMALPLAKIIAATVVIVSVVLAIGAHW